MLAVLRRVLAQYQCQGASPTACKSWRSLSLLGNLGTPTTSAGRQVTDLDGDTNAMVGMKCHWKRDEYCLI